jgi:hypothetical protein
MKKTFKLALLGVAAPALLIADVSFEAPLGLRIVRNAAAIVGAPLTPVSAAGVARRTTRRVVAVEATAATTAAASAQQQQQQQQQQKAQQQAAAAPAPPPPASGPLPVGTVVGALPPGCVSAPISGVEYYLCSGNYYRPAFQGNNLVYVVQKP